MRRVLSLALLATVVVGTPPPFQVAAYLPEWRYEGANWVTICETVTHLFLFSIEVVTSTTHPPPTSYQSARARALTSGP